MSVTLNSELQNRSELLRCKFYTMLMHRLKLSLCADVDIFIIIAGKTTFL